MKNLIKYTLVLISIIWAFNDATAQVIGINTDTPDNTSVLDIVAPHKDKGVLAPRLTTIQRNNIANPAEGLLVYDTNLNVYTYWNGTQWIETMSNATIAQQHFMYVQFRGDTIVPIGSNASPAASVEEKIVNATNIVKQSSFSIASIDGAGSGGVKIQTPGQYIISVSAILTNLAGANNQALQANIIVFLNGTKISQLFYHLPVSSSTTQPRSLQKSFVVMDLQPGDVITLRHQKILPTFAGNAGVTLNNMTGRFSNILLELTKLPYDCDEPIITPPPLPAPESAIYYIGTFHRWNQTGERVIYSPNTGAWSATISYPSGTEPFVVLSTTPSPDSNIYTNNPGDAENYQITDGSSSVNGTGNVYFRVGLTGKLASQTTAPRYAVINVTTVSGEGIKNIYVRQGEAPDYAPGPSSGVGGAVWSPYNLSDKRNFVDYPTQAGYFYQWGNTPNAYHPINPVDATPDGWIASSGSSYALFRVCPTDYRLPADDYPSEIMLMYSAPHIAGYYADGFFDRRPIVQNVTVESDLSHLDNPGPDAYLYGTVSCNSSNYADPMNTNVAYAGMLFYNTTNDASIFFPMPGTRQGEGIPAPQNLPPGGLRFAGTTASYWTSTPAGDDDSGAETYGASGHMLNVSIGYDYPSSTVNYNAYQSFYPTSFGYSVRCVAQ
ncbi:MAG: fibrobacter succinogenes major paralogous domain-containing protein [Paludibacter sp.]|nr:fibrobacter succinogenes major paralogous domain-containing protein [Paludibacter sp.]